MIWFHSKVQKTLFYQTDFKEWHMKIFFKKLISEFSKTWAKTFTVFLCFYQTLFDHFKASKPNQHGKLTHSMKYFIFLSKSESVPLPFWETFLSTYLSPSHFSNLKSLSLKPWNILLYYLGFSLYQPQNQILLFESVDVYNDLNQSYSVRLRANFIFLASLLLLLYISQNPHSFIIFSKQPKNAQNSLQ